MGGDGRFRILDRCYCLVDLLYCCTFPYIFYSTLETKLKVLTSLEKMCALKANTFLIKNKRKSDF